MSTMSGLKKTLFRPRRVPLWTKLAFQTAVGLLFLWFGLVLGDVTAFPVYFSVVGTLIVAAAVGLATRQSWALLLEAAVFAILALSSGVLALSVIARDPSEFLNWCKALNHGLFVVFFLCNCVVFADRWKAQRHAHD